MIDFDVSEAFDLPTYKDEHVRHLDLKSLNEFWLDCDPEHGGMRNGCYIFGIRTKNITPWYVGKTWKGFKKETFNPYQQTKINQFINKHGTPVVIFVFKKFKKHESAYTKDRSAGSLPHPRSVGGLANPLSLQHRVEHYARDRLPLRRPGRTAG
jgi:hypothetical protein